MNKKWDLNKTVIILYLLFSVGISAFNYFIKLDYSAMVAGICMPFFLLIPPLFYKVFRLKPVKELSLAVYCYAFLAFGLGVAGRLYRITLFYDKFVHFLAGYAFAIFGMVVYYCLKRDKKVERAKENAVVQWFSAATSLGIGVIWEIFEYADYLILGHDAQHVLTTGIHDTMQDLIACTVGAAVAAAFIGLYCKRDVKGPLIYTFERFIETNFGLGKIEEPLGDIVLEIKDVQV